MDSAQRQLRWAWIARLRPQGEVDLGRGAGQGALVELAVARLGGDAVRWAVEQSAVVVRRIVDQVPALGGSPAAVEMLRRANEVTTLRALITLAGGPGAAPPDDEATADGIREFVHRGVPLERVLQGVRVGHAATTEAFLRACADLVEPQAALGEVTEVSGELFAYVDELTDAMIRTYLVEHEAWTTSAAAARAATVRGLLDESAAPDIDVASRALVYDLRRTHQAVVLWSDTPGASSALQAAAVEVLRARGATTTLVVPVAAGRLWAWGSVATDPARRTTSDEDVTRAVARRQVQVAFGNPAAGVAGFRRSQREAEAGARVEQLRHEAGQAPRAVTAYSSVALVALLSADLEAAGDFVRHELGGLAARTAAMGALRTTLYHYIGAERSLVDVARRLHVARGTVTYRVRRAQDVLGHDLDDRLLALHTALTLAEELGDAVLLAPGVRT